MSLMFCKDKNQNEDNLKENETDVCCLNELTINEISITGSTPQQTTTVEQSGF